MGRCPNFSARQTEILTEVMNSDDNRRRLVDLGNNTAEGKIKKHRAWEDIYREYRHTCSVYNEFPDHTIEHVRKKYQNIKATQRQEFSESVYKKKCQAFKTEVAKTGNREMYTVLNELDPDQEAIPMFYHKPNYDYLNTARSGNSTIPSRMCFQQDVFRNSPPSTAAAGSSQQDEFRNSPLMKSSTDAGSLGFGSQQGVFRISTPLPSIAAAGNSHQDVFRNSPPMPSTAAAGSSQQDEFRTPPLMKSSTDAGSLGFGSQQGVFRISIPLPSIAAAGSSNQDVLQNSPMPSTDAAGSSEQDEFRTPPPMPSTEAGSLGFGSQQGVFRTSTAAAGSSQQDDFRTPPPMPSTEAGSLGFGSQHGVFRTSTAVAGSSQQDEFRTPPPMPSTDAGSLGFGSQHGVFRTSTAAAGSSQQDVSTPVHPTSSMPKLLLQSEAGYNPDDNGLDDQNVQDENEFSKEHANRNDDRKKEEHDYEMASKRIRRAMDVRTRSEQEHLYKMQLKCIELDMENKKKAFKVFTVQEAYWTNLAKAEGMEVTNDDPRIAEA